MAGNEYQFRDSYSYISVSLHIAWEVLAVS
jgi:hypothetical protein